MKFTFLKGGSKYDEMRWDKVWEKWNRERRRQCAKTEYRSVRFAFSSVKTKKVHLGIIKEARKVLVCLPTSLISWNFYRVVWKHTRCYGFGSVGRVLNSWSEFSIILDFLGLNLIVLRKILCFGFFPLIRTLKSISSLILNNS